MVTQQVPKDSRAHQICLPFSTITASPGVNELENLGGETGKVVEALNFILSETPSFGFIHSVPIDQAPNVCQTV